MENKQKEYIVKLLLEHPDLEVLTEPEDCLIYSHGCYPREYKWLQQGKYPYVTNAVLIPNTEEEICTAVRLANEMNVKIIPYGGGSGIVGGTIPYHGEIIMDTKKICHFSLNAKNGTAVGGCGLSGAEFENRLNELGYTCGHYPQSFQSACLGGMVATRAIGTFSTKYGKMDDIVTRLHVVLPDGSLLKTHPAPKRSTGPELCQLFLGSEGVYGVITEVEMKIYPLPETRKFLSYTFPSTPEALEAIRIFTQAGLKPAVVRLYDETEAIPKLKKYQFEKGFALLFLVFEGLAEAVETESILVDKICVAHGGRDKGAKPSEDWLATRFSTKKMLDYDAVCGGTADAIEVAAPWDRIVEVWKEMRAALDPVSEVVDCHFSHVYHSGASIYVIFHAKTGGDDKAGEERYLDCLDKAITASLAHGGNVSHHHGVGTAKAAYLPGEHGESGMAVFRSIKQALDPNGILNKGVLGV